MSPASVAGWLDRYGAAWSSADAAAAAALFSRDAVYWWGPFDRLEGTDAIHARWELATADLERVDFHWDLLGEAGDRQFVHWRVTLQPTAGPAVELDGAFVLDFDSHGLCTQLHEWWLTRELS